MRLKASVEKSIRCRTRQRRRSEDPLVELDVAVAGQERQAHGMTSLRTLNSRLHNCEYSEPETDIGSGRNRGRE